MPGKGHSTTEKHNRDESRPRAVCPEICDVCGLAATGYHYDVASCNGCKTFFRRAIVCQRRFACKQEGACATSQGERLKCRACRFERCIQAGMNPLAIQSVQPPEANPVVQYMMIKRKQIAPAATNEPSTSKLVSSPLTTEDRIDRVIGELMHLELAFDKLRKSNFTKSKTEFMVLTVEDCLKGPSQLGIDHGVAPQTERFDLPVWCKILPLAYRVRHRIPFERPQNIPSGRENCCTTTNRKNWNIMDIVHSIEYLKSFQFFHQLSASDRLTLAKHTALMTSILTNSFFSMEQGSDCTLRPDGFAIDMRRIEMFSSDDAKYDRMMCFETIANLRKLQLDKREYVTLKALIACNPGEIAIEDLSTPSRKIMQAQREAYTKALLSYVMARRGFSEAPLVFAEIMAHVDWLTRLVQKNKELHVLISALGLIQNPPTIMEEVFHA